MAISTPTPPLSPLSVASWSHTHTQLPPAFHASLEAFLIDKAHWIKTYQTTQPLRGKKIALTTQEQVQGLYQILTSARFCRQRPSHSLSFLKVITTAVSQQQPIPITLIHGPLKNRNNASYQHPDWAEWFSGIQLHRLGAAIKTLHEPGLRITYLLDDARAEHANRICSTITHTYQTQLNQFLVAMGFNHLIQEVQSLRPVYEHPHWAEHYTAASQEVLSWWNDPLFASRQEQYCTHAQRNSYGLEKLPKEEQQAYIQAAAYRYCVAFHAEQRAGIWDSSQALTMLYSAYEGYHQLFTLRRGSVSQPWQGQGAVLWHNARWDVTLLTQNFYTRQDPQRCLYPYTASIGPSLPLPVIVDLP
ncbi:MAG: hypothetical protein U0003_05035 [Vampirovibrionales bacterium]